MKKMLVILSMALSLLLTSCGTNTTGTTTPASEEPNQNSEVTQTPTNSYKDKVLKIATDTTYMPMEYLENGEFKGFSIDLLKAICGEMGVKYEMQTVAWDSIFDGLYAGKYDLISSSITINNDRKKTMLFSDPYFDSMAVAVVRNNSNIENMNNFTGKSLIVQPDTSFFEIISKNVPGINFIKQNDAVESLKDFNNGKYDGVLSDLPIIAYFINQNKDKGYKMIKDETLFPKDQFGFAATKENTQLIADINTTLAKLKSNGKYQEIYDEYFK